MIHVVCFVVVAGDVDQVDAVSVVIFMALAGALKLAAFLLNEKFCRENMFELSAQNYHYLSREANYHYLSRETK